MYDHAAQIAQILQKESAMTSKTILDATADDAATMNSWSDRNPATIVKRTAKTIMVQEDDATAGERFELGGYPRMWLFERNYDAPIKTYTLRRNGRWIAAGAPMNSRGNSLTIGRRDFYRDPSF
jgi:hypothetical protein